MGQMLKELPFEAWVRHVFDHEVGDPAWYFSIDADIWDAPHSLSAAYMTRLFEDPLPQLAAYTDAQLNQGFWYLVSNGGSIHMFALLDEAVPLGDRIRCVRAIYPLFASLFAARCTPHLSHQDEPGSSPLNSACYMWWDLIPVVPKPGDWARAAFDLAVLEVMERTLSLDSPACQESALHGLGHWASDYPVHVEAIVGRYLKAHSALREDLRRYAQRARKGAVL